MGVPPYLNFITDTFGRFSLTDSADVRWETANSLIRDIGGTAVNIGAIDLDAQTPSWILSSMSPEWLEQYVSEKLYEIDPLIPHLKTSNLPYLLDTEKVVSGQPLNEKLLAAGYHFLYGLPFSGARTDERKIVTYCTDFSLGELQADGTLECIRMLAAILITKFTGPDEHDGRDIFCLITTPFRAGKRNSYLACTRRAKHSYSGTDENF